MKIGIMAAMPAEVNTIHHDIPFYERVAHGEREYMLGQFESIELVLVFSRCGKVSAATTATTLIEKFAVDKLIFTGVGGAVDPRLNIGDIVLASKTYQHDMDGRPIFPRFEIPLTGRLFMETDPQAFMLAKEGIDQFIQRFDQYLDLAMLAKLGVHEPKLYTGIIATGDQFIQDAFNHEALQLQEEPVLAVEMEGAAVAQVCTEFKVPYMLIRTISDKADHSAAINFQTFIDNIASHYSSAIVQEILKHL